METLRPVHFFLASLLLACSGLAAQTPVQPDKDPAKAYVDEQAVVEHDATVYRYAADGTGTRVETIAVKVQSGAALQTFAVLSFPYASGTQTLDITYARVRKPDGSVTETPTTDAQDQPAPVTQTAPMYSDYHLKQLPVRSLAVGDMLEFEVKMTQKRAEVPGEFWGAENFGAGLIYLDRTIELRVPKSKSITIYSPKYPPQTTEIGEERVYRWKGTQLRRSNAKEDDTVAAKFPPIGWTTFASWEAVGTWYQGLIAGRDAVTPALQAKADELTSGAKTDTDKVRALYEFVAQHNHYIAIDFGIGRYQPHLAAEVLADQYGDCKDKHTLLAALLRAKGFQPSAVLIGAGVEMNEKLPSPAAFNHLITLVDVDGSPVWLDTTTEVAPYRVLVAVLRDKPALVVPAKSGPGTPHLTKTPAELPFPAMDRYDGHYELAKDGTTKGNATISMRGDDELVMRYASRQVARAQWDQLGQTYVANRGFFGKSNDVSLDMANDLSAPWEMKYGYTQDAWSEWKNFQIGSLLPNVNLPSIDEQSPPKQEIDLGGRRTQIAKSTIKLPAGYGVELPNAVHLKLSFATFDQTYKVADGELVSEFTLEVLKPKIDAAEWKDVKKITDASVQPWIQLISKEQSLGENGPPAAGESNPAAAALVGQVEEAIVAKNLNLAQKKSDEAIALNSKQAYAWSQRGWLAWKRGDLGQASDNYVQELTQHPHEVYLYPQVIQLQHLLGRPDAERSYLLQYAKEAPENAQALLYAGNQLLASNHVDDAVSVYKAGSKAIPDNKLLQVELGSALLRQGKAAEATAVLQAALEGSSDPDVLNDGAYALSNEGAAALLPLAETSARKALEVLERELASTSLDSVNTESMVRNNLLLATWDTLGWIYFSEGKSELAEDYVRGAWRSLGHSEVGLHLGEIMEKRGDDKGAMRVYEQAMSQTRSDDKSPAAVQIRERMGALKKKGFGVQDLHPELTLQEQRTFHVPRPGELKGSAVFAVQLSAVKTEKVKMIVGDEEVRGLSDALGKLDLGLAVPKESHGLLLRSGVLFCSTQPTCEFVLKPTDSAQLR